MENELGMLGFFKDMFGLFVLTIILSFLFGAVGTVIGVILFFITAAIRVVQIINHDTKEMDK